MNLKGDRPQMLLNLKMSKFQELIKSYRDNGTQQTTTQTGCVRDGMENKLVDPLISEPIWDQP